MIRSNLATELCITKGQEGLVHGWISGTGCKGQTILQVLFVRLVNPPQNVQFEDLPENVVPVYKTVNSTLVHLPKGPAIRVSRTQVEVLPNFAMTDYASQGKTRPNNPVDLNSSRTHLHIYTALSRSTSAEGTLILDKFSIPKITSGLTGALRQEFRELEILDFITLLNYKGKLKSDIMTGVRNSTIQRFLEAAGDKSLPKNLHHAIRWSPESPFCLDSEFDSPWQLSSIPLVEKPDKKRPHDEIDNSVKDIFETIDIQATEGKKSKPATKSDKHKGKKQKTYHTSADDIMDEQEDQVAFSPQGTKWVNNSCAYDAIVTIFFNLWMSNPIYWTNAFNSYQPTSTYLSDLAQDFELVQSLNMSLGRSRDRFLDTLAADKPIWFVRGKFASVNDALYTMLESPWNVVSTVAHCLDRHPNTFMENFHNTNSHLHLHSTDDIVQPLQTRIYGAVAQSTRDCSVCHIRMSSFFAFQTAPPILAFDTERCKCSIDSNLLIQVRNGVFRYHLAGIIYYGANHFTCRVINNKHMWFHNGFLPGLLDQGIINEDRDLYYYGQQRAVAVIYHISVN